MDITHTKKIFDPSELEPASYTKPWLYIEEAYAKVIFIDLRIFGASVLRTFNAYFPLRRVFSTLGSVGKEGQIKPC